MKNVQQVIKKARALEKSGDAKRAEQLYRDVLTAFPGNRDARKNLARLQKPDPAATIPPAELQKVTSIYNSGAHREAATLSKSLLSRYPRSFLLWHVYAASLRKLGYTTEALQGFEKVIELNPKFPDAYNALGVLHIEENKWDAAIACYKTTLEQFPEFADAYYNMGLAFKAKRDLAKAAECFETLRSLDPENAKAWSELGWTQLDSGDLVKATASFRKSLDLDPGQAMTEAIYYHALKTMCDWSTQEDVTAACAQMGITTSSVAPFITLPLEDNPERQMQRSLNWAQENYKISEGAVFTPPPSKPDKLKIGYFSADFRTFPGMFLMAEMLARHDRERFEVYAFSYAHVRQDDMTERVRRNVDDFIDLRDLSDREVATLVRDMGIDIAVHRNGYTRNQRTRIFAQRIAPIQVNYLGYPGTLGADFIDYIVADPIVIPPGQRQFYSEKVIYLPHSYQPNDDTRVISSLSRTRADYALPDEGFVFCCFNNIHKISPEEFDIWMRIMRQVENSVLWLLRQSPEAVDNLRKEAARRGVDPDRIVFADKEPHADHLYRHVHADLFLDTFNYNAHTTASDALWAGLPVVTKAGEQFAARVSASLLNAVGLNELITHSAEAYEALILNLARDPARLQAIRQRLVRNRASYPLFDTNRYTRHLEAGFQAAYQAYFEGRAPQDIRVSDKGS